MIWLKAMRERENLSQADVSKAVGITQASYSNIENGKRTPSVSVAKKVAAILDFDWTRFYDEADAGEEDSTDEKAALENGETTINAVRQRCGLSPLKSGGADQRLKKLD